MSFLLVSLLFSAAAELGQLDVWVQCNTLTFLNPSSQSLAFCKITFISCVRVHRAWKSKACSFFQVASGLNSGHRLSDKSLPAESSLSFC